VLIRLGVAYEAIGQEKEAARAYERAIENAPELFVSYKQLAWLYARQGIELSRALELARKADGLRPGNASILDTLGWIHFQLGSHAEALERLEQAHAARSDDAVVLYHLAAVQMALGEREASRQRLEQAFAIAQDFQGAEEARGLLRQLQ
jgi:tetratricopeptide (TPR) repeat protein